MSAEDVQPARRPLWKRVVGRALKRLLTWRYRGFRPDAQPARWRRVAGLRLRVLPSVFDPALHFTSGFLAAYLRRPGVIRPGESVLDLGTGSGIVAIAAARAGAGPVSAVDINPAAVRCARANVRRYGLQGQVGVVLGDLFSPTGSTRFGLVVCNPPYFRGQPQTPADLAYRAGPHYEWLDRFAATVPAHVAPGGRVLVVLGDAGDIPAVLRHLAPPGWQVDAVACRDILVEVLYVYALTAPA